MLFYRGGGEEEGKKGRKEVQDYGPFVTVFFFLSLFCFKCLCVSAYIRVR